MRTTVRLVSLSETELSKEKKTFRWRNAVQICEGVLEYYKEKALFYFEKAVEASPNDSIILGEYARFLWEIEE
ncbi:unnamed protein product [Eruca vesicaria subsp. sativa]|uniref:Tetratricopeptide repeat protein n=1 Tax=Eruca vesicaria subsp. sativa TaxID=29727 RepID=A0ABC8IQD7_ERUVS|nr:unnamed protein product [Eruca vesicaria subsp. sativa]